MTARIALAVVRPSDVTAALIEFRFRAMVLEAGSEVVCAKALKGFGVYHKVIPSESNCPKKRSPGSVRCTAIPSRPEK